MCQDVFATIVAIIGGKSGGYIYYFSRFRYNKALFH
jgi:hypothetical protein